MHASQPTVAKVKDWLLAEEEARKMAYSNAGATNTLPPTFKDPCQLTYLQACEVN
jgi:hypothetical protein